ncbi:alpha/beta hydrolase [Edaphobacter flagellatus]|uniref:alpha/beta hydrolase n=1 Tax=Edaphobacter flagellatus TaxID=1933044 RepID=UPI0021B1DBD9|nr:acetylxylan esterase [Edaphobacter flagellatus]
MRIFTTNRRYVCFLFAFLVTPTISWSQTTDAPAIDYAAQTDAYLTNIAKQKLAERQEQIAGIKKADDMHIRQEYIRHTLLQEIGGFPARTPLHAEITGTIDHPDYVVQKLIYQSLPGFYVTANVYVPKNAHKPFPAVLGLAGHSGEGKSFALYQAVWVSLARRGFLVLAIDPVGQGERMEHLDPATHKPLLQIGGTPEHMADGLPVLLTGTNIGRYFIWDGIRGIDYLQSRDDVDKTRIGVAGNSGGGTQSAYISTLDTRVAAAVISCYLSAWSAMWADPGPQDSEQIFDHFLSDHLDYADFLNEIAPRPVEMEVATRDFFPIQGAHATFREAEHTFELLDAKDHLALFEADDTHGWSKPRRIAAYTWLSRWLQGNAGSSEEAAVQTDSSASLNATSTGQVLTTYPHAQTVQSLNASLAQQLRSKPFRGNLTQLAERVRSRLDLPASVTAAKVETAGSYVSGALKAEKLNLHPEPGITVPGLLFTPAGTAARRSAILYLDSSGMTADAVPGGLIQQLVELGNVVLAIDPRGWGESAPPNRMISGYRSDYQLAMHAILVGKSIPGMQTLDVLSAFRYLATRSDINPGAISLHTVGFACNIGLFAATIEPHIRTVVCDKQPMSYLAITELPLYNLPPEVIVPGVLRDFDIPDITRLLGSRLHIESRLQTSMFRQRSTVSLGAGGQ